MDLVSRIVDRILVLTMVPNQNRIFLIFGREVIQCPTLNLERLIVARTQYDQIPHESLTYPKEKKHPKNVKFK